jgi:hypothetical protein
MGIYGDGCLLSRAFRFNVAGVCDGEGENGFSRYVAGRAAEGIIAFCAKHKGVF